jgi:poly(hydroxyalkanoate) granule-associated protein
LPLCGKDLDNIAAPRYIRGVECRKAAKDPNRRARAAETDMEDLTMAKKKSKEVQNDIMESAHKVWLAGLGAVAIAEQQGGKFFANLVDEGQKLEKKSKAKVEKAKGTVSGMKTVAESYWETLGRTVDDRITAAIHRIGVPTKDEIELLTKKVEELTVAVDKLRTKETAKPKRKSAASASSPTKKSSSTSS